MPPSLSGHPMKRQGLPHRIPNECPKQQHVQVVSISGLDTYPLATCCPVFRQIVKIRVLLQNIPYFGPGFKDFQKVDGKPSHPPNPASNHRFSPRRRMTGTTGAARAAGQRAIPAAKSTHATCARLWAFGAWLLGCLVAWLLGWLVAWLAGWLLGWLFCFVLFCLVACLFVCLFFFVCLFIYI